MFCLNCGERRPYRTKSKFVDSVVRGFRFKWIEDIALCAICGQEVYVPIVNDLNCYRRERAYFVTKEADGKTCSSCEKFLGGGDWGLCCKIKWGLTYEDSPACKEYEVKKDERIPQD